MDNNNNYKNEPSSYTHLLKQLEISIEQFYKSFDNENIECVDIITAVNIKGIAGKEISWIKVSPSEFKLAVAFGRKNPRSSESGSI